MKNLKCDSCGANMIVDDNNKDYAVCEYCGAKTKLSQDINLNINVDEDIKKGLKTGGKLIAGISIVPFLIAGLIIVVAFGMIIFITIKGFTSFNNNVKNDRDTEEKFDQEFERDMFNATYKIYSGSHDLNFLEGLFISVINNNKINNEHKITIVYNDTSTSNPTEIEKLKEDMNSSSISYNFKITLNYDSDGYVNKITFKEE